MLAVLALFVAGTASLGAAAPLATAGTVADSYIVVFKPGAVRDIPAAAHALSSANGNVTFVSRYALQGFALHAPADRVGALENDPRVAYVEPDRVVHADATRARRRGGSTGSTSGACRSATPTRTTTPAQACTPTSSTRACAPRTRSSPGGSATATRP